MQQCLEIIVVSLEEVGQVYPHEEQLNSFSPNKLPITKSL